MAKSKTYNTDTGVTVWIPGRPEIRVNAGEPYETSDPAEQEALDATPELTSSSPRDAKKEQKESKSDG